MIFGKKIAKIYSKVSNNSEDQIIIDPEWNIIRKIVIALNGVDILTRPLNVPNLKSSNMLYICCLHPKINHKRHWWPQKAEGFLSYHNFQNYSLKIKKKCPGNFKNRPQRRDLTRKSMGWADIQKTERERGEGRGYK